MAAQIGIYCLGNDAVYDWLAALFVSLRRHSPHVAVTLIPFDERLAKTRVLCAEHGVDVLPSDGLASLDTVSREIWPNLPVGYLRKLAVFWGPYEHFLFLDADVVVIKPVEHLLEAARTRAREVLYVDGDLDMVYRPGSLRAQMVVEHGARGINTGTFGGSRGLVSLGAVRRAATLAAGVREHFIDIYEMGFVNFVLDVTDVPCLSFNDTIGDVWPAWVGYAYRSFPDGRRWLRIQPPVMMHWAGFPLTSRIPYYRLWLNYRMPGRPLAAVTLTLRIDAAHLARRLLKRTRLKLRV